MRSICHVKVGIGAAILAAFLTGPVLGASKISYIATLDGDNHAADWKAGTRMLYSGANEADGQYFKKTLPIPYAIKLKAEGVHSQPGHLADGDEIYGAANVVYNLAIYKDSVSPANLATGATFYSSINNGQNGDPQANAAFAVSYYVNGLGGLKGRLIDQALYGGPRMEPIFTYPTAQPGKLIGQGAGYKEWNKTGNSTVATYAGVGMVTMPGGIPGLGIVPIGEGQIDMSNLADGTYILEVTPGAGNNVLRGDFNMNASTNRPAFAVAANETVTDTIQFTIGEHDRCIGIVGRHILYNNSKWDNNGSAITSADWNAIAPDKHPLLPGDGQATFANYISYTKRINCIVVDACSFSRAPVLDQDILFVMGNDLNDPFSWTQIPVAPDLIQVFPGEGVNGSDRLVIRWADGAIPNSRWLLTGLFAGDGSLGIPADDFFLFGVAVGESTGDFIVSPSDEAACRPPNQRTAFNPATINDPHDYNRDKIVGPTDEAICRPPNQTTPFNSLKKITW